MVAHRIGLCFLLSGTACASGQANGPPSNADTFSLKVIRVAEVEPAKIVLDEDEDEDEDRGDATSAAGAFGASREVGDYFVYRFSGSFTPQAMTLTEKVVAKRDGCVVVDFTLQGTGPEQKLRVRLDETTGEVVGVTSRDARGERTVPKSAYADLLAKTQLVPERNERVVDTEESTCLVGEDPITCSVTTYAVSVRGQDATLNISRSESLPARDLGGDIVAKNGNVLYSARLIDRGTDDPPSDPVARHEEGSKPLSPSEL